MIISRRALIAAMLLCLVFCVVLALDLIPGLRGDYGWRWPYALPDWPRLLPFITALAVYLLGLFGLRNVKQSWIWLVWCFVGAVAIPLAALYTLGDPLYLLATRTFSGLATGDHMAGAEIVNAAQTMRDWPQLMPTYIEPGKHIMESMHIALGPPGLPLFYHALNVALAAVPGIADPLGLTLRLQQCQNYAIMAYTNPQIASAWFGVLMPVWAALTGLPLYRAAGGKQIGRWAAAWWALIPSAAMFTPTWNTVYPLLAILAYLLLRPGVAARPSIRAQVGILASGMVISLATFANVSIVPMIAFLGLYCAVIFLQGLLNPSQFPLSTKWRGGQGVRMTRRDVILSALRTLILFLLGLASVWIVYWLLSGVTPMAILSQALGQHLELDRPYLPWIYLHLYDLALFAGFPLVLLSLAAMAPNLRRSLRTLDPLGVALALTLIILALSGTARGETGRVWLFFVPFILILAAQQLDRMSKADSPIRGAAMLITLTQIITLITLVAFLRVMGTELNPPPTAPPTQQTAAVDPLPAPVTFANAFTLTGKSAVVTSGGIDLTLVWRDDQQVSVPYYLSALVVGPEGQPIPPATNWQPFDTNYPMTCWKPGQTVVETRHISVASMTTPGNYWISLSAFDVSDPAKKGVPVTQPNAPPDTQIGIGPVPVR